MEDGDDESRIVYPKNGYAAGRQPMARPTRHEEGTPFTNDIRRLKTRYSICDVVQNDDFDITLTILHSPTDPEFQEEWLEGVGGLLFCIEIPQNFIEDSTVSVKLDLIAPNSEIAKLAKQTLATKFSLLMQQYKTFYKSLVELDKWYITPAFLEAATTIHNQKLEAEELKNKQEQEKQQKASGSNQKPGSEITPQDLPGSEEWSTQEQADLEEALQKAEKLDFPDIKFKWRWIANKVGGGKSAKQCAQRFNYCRQKAIEQQTPQIQVQKQANTSDTTHEQQSAPLLTLANESTVIKTGTPLSVSGIDLKGISDLTLANVDMQVRCNRCKQITTHSTGTLKKSGVTSSRFQCDTCKQNGCVHIVPSAMTLNTPSFGKILIENFTLRDINIIDCTAVCSECTSSTLLQKVIRGGKKLTRCHNCHTNQHVKIDTFLHGVSIDKNDNSTKKKKQNPDDFVLKVGNPLPENGTCKHYSKSFRWLRFPCCGKAYPCDICHDTKEDHEHVYATRMICGFCSRETQYSNTKVCECGKAFNKNRSAFWEGGQGTRNKNAMSSKDKHKYSGMTKTMSNKAKAEKFGRHKK